MMECILTPVLWDASLYSCTSSGLLIVLGSIPSKPTFRASLNFSSTLSSFGRTPMQAAFFNEPAAQAARGEAEFAPAFRQAPVPSRVPPIAAAVPAAACMNERLEMFFRDFIVVSFQKMIGYRSGSSPLGAHSRLVFAATGLAMR